MRYGLRCKKDNTEMNLYLRLLQLFMRTFSLENEKGGKIGYEVGIDIYLWALCFCRETYHYCEPQYPP